MPTTTLWTSKVQEATTKSIKQERQEILDGLIPLEITSPTGNSITKLVRSELLLILLAQSTIHPTILEWRNFLLWNLPLFGIHMLPLQTSLNWEQEVEMPWLALFTMRTCILRILACRTITTASYLSTIGSEAGSKWWPCKKMETSTRWNHSWEAPSLTPWWTWKWALTEKSTF